MFDLRYGFIKTFREAAVGYLIALFVLAGATGCVGRGGSRTAPTDVVRIESGRVSAGRFMVGAATADITPDGRVWMAGLRIFRKSKGVHDRLMAHALVIKADDVTIRLVSLDLIGMWITAVRRYRDDLWNSGNEPPPIIACTHTHSGPDTLGMWSGVSEDYKAFIGEQIKKALREAEENAVEAELLVGMGTLPDGTVKNIRETDLLDLEVGTLQFIAVSDNKPIATVVNFAAHPEVLWSDNRLLSADFCHYLYRDIEARGGGVPIFFNGAAGAMVTPDVRSRPRGGFVHSFEEAERIAGLMMRGVNDAMGNAVKVETDDVEWRREVFLVPVENPLFKKARKLGLISRSIVDGNKFITEVEFIRIGPVKIVTIPGELSPRLGLDIKAASGTPYTFIIALANDELGYLLPESAYQDPVYSYESTVSPGPAAATIIKNKALEMVGTGG